MEWYGYILAGLAAVAAGIVNALAGGGTLITFPVLTALGLPALSANVTNTVALCPGYLGGTYSQRNDLRGQSRRLWMFLPVSVLGGVAGGVLLIYSGERVFREIVPYLILLAAGLLACQGTLRKWILRRSGKTEPADMQDIWALLMVIPAAVYGGYFGAGVGVILLAVLGLTLEDSLTRLNALKQAMSFSLNMAAAIFFLFSGQVNWPVALVMVSGALAGGMLGGRFAGSIRPGLLRWIVVTIGVIVAVLFFVRN
jgi:uncharacterized membrane protein YfcA